MATVTRDPLFSPRYVPPRPLPFQQQNLLLTTLAKPIFGRVESKTQIPRQNQGFVSYFEPFLLETGAKPFKQDQWRPTRPIDVTSEGYVWWKIYDNPAPPGRYHFGQTQIRSPNQGFTSYFEPFYLETGEKPFAQYDWRPTKAILQLSGAVFDSNFPLYLSVLYPFAKYDWNVTQTRPPDQGWVDYFTPDQLSTGEKPFAKLDWPQTQQTPPLPGFVLGSKPDVLNQGTMPFVNLWFGTTTVIPQIQGWVLGRLMELPSLPPGKTTAWQSTQVAQVVGWEPQNFPQFVLETQGLKPFAQYDWKPTQPTKLLPPGFVFSSDMALFTFVPPVFTGELRNPPYVGVSPGQMGTWGTW